MYTYIVSCIIYVLQYFIIYINTLCVYTLYKYKYGDKTPFAKFSYFSDFSYFDLQLKYILKAV